MLILWPAESSQRLFWKQHRSSHRPLVHSVLGAPRAERLGQYLTSVWNSVVCGSSPGMSSARARAGPLGVGRA